MSIYRTTGTLMLGTRLKRLSERFLSEVTTIYKTLNIPFEPAWFPLFYLLDKHEQITVTDVARELEITQSGASQLVSSLEKKGLVICAKDPADRRVRMVRFTGRGTELQAMIAPVWKAIGHSMQQILAQDENGQQLLAAMNGLEQSMNATSLADKVLTELSHGGKA